jgi:hypothetical protein
MQYHGIPKPMRLPGFHPSCTIVFLISGFSFAITQHCHQDHPLLFPPRLSFPPVASPNSTTDSAPHLKSDSYPINSVLSLAPVSLELKKIPCHSPPPKNQSPNSISVIPRFFFQTDAAQVYKGSRSTPPENRPSVELHHIY